VEPAQLCYTLSQSFSADTMMGLHSLLDLWQVLFCHFSVPSVPLLLILHLSNYHRNTGKVDFTRVSPNDINEVLGIWQVLLPSSLALSSKQGTTYPPQIWQPPSKPSSWHPPDLCQPYRTSHSLVQCSSSLTSSLSLHSHHSLETQQPYLTA